MSVFDPRALIRADITSLKMKKKALQLKRLIGLSTQSELDEIDKKIRAKKEALKNISRWMI